MAVAADRSVDRRRVITWLIVALAVVVVGLVGYRVTHGPVALASDPSRILWCGRDYHRGSPASPAGVSLVSVGRVPPVVGHPVLAPATRLDGACPTVIYLQTGDSYRSYELSGGP